MSPIPHLLIHSGSSSVLLALDGESFLLGRDPECAVQLDASCISFRHLEFLAFGNGNYEVIDRKSRNGTTVNGITIGRCHLHDGDVIRLGGGMVTIHFMLLSDSLPEYAPEIENPATSRFGSFQERFDALRTEVHELECTLHRKEKEYSRLLDLIFKLKSDPNRVYREIYEKEDGHFPIRSGRNHREVTKEDDVALPA